MLPYEEKVKAFGTWDAPITDGAEWIDTPTDRTCAFCREWFQEGDNGAIMPTNLAEHRECGFRATQGGIGHWVDHAYFCKGELGTDAGLTARASALLVWQHVVEGVPISREHLLMLNGIVE